MSKTSLGAVATAAALTIGLAAPAAAASIGVKDPADIGHGVDLRAVQVANGERNLRIVLNHTNLRRDPRTVRAVSSTSTPTPRTGDRSSPS